MNKQSIKKFLLAAMAMVGLFLYNAWEAEHPRKKEQLSQSSRVEKGKIANSEINDLPSNISEGEKKQKKELNAPVFEKGHIIVVSTDLMVAKISKKGGDLVFLELKKYPVSLQNKTQGIVLLDSSDSRNYIVQSGLLSEFGPDSPKKGRADYTSDLAEYTLQGNNLVVDLHCLVDGNVTITKRFIFTRGSYVVNMEYMVSNQGSKSYAANFYGRVRRASPDKSETKGMAGKSYTGGAIYSPEFKYRKESFADIEKSPFNQQAGNGWVAMVERYFLTALIPNAGSYKYRTEHFSDDTFSVGFVGQKVVVKPGEQVNVEANIYAGPELIQNLKTLAPGLELTVDYGSLWWLCQPIFYLMSWLYSLVKNWGVAIILVTIIIKLAFYKLSASSYRSMGNMKKLQPKMNVLKERYGDDKQKFGQAVMELYKKEKVNPLGGCLPILIQIPVFIALYYVLLESVELRQAPFMLWLNDLSVKDPYYVLPLIMGASMFVQQRMNPAPPDPIQAKVMMFMPAVFTVLFFQFPSGLVLYWVVNNLLSILQQWYITRTLGTTKAKS